MSRTFSALPLTLSVALLVLTAAGAQAAPINPEEAAAEPASVVDPTDPTTFRVHTDGTLAGEVVWTLELDHQGEVSVLVPLG